MEDIVLELARVEREALARVLAKIASRQLGEAWSDLKPQEAETHSPPGPPPERA
jgi:hypothetical protein